MRYSASFRAGSQALKALLIWVAAIAFSGPAMAQDGEALFRANCSSCHKIDAPLTGPALKGVQERWEGKEELLYEWIKNPQAVIDKGDPYVTQLLAEWKPKGGIMNAQAVNDEEITAILTYIENWEPEQPAQAADGGAGAATAQQAEDDGNTWAWLLAIGLVLLIIIFSLSNVSQSLESAVREQRGEEQVPDFTYGERVKMWMWKNKAFVSIVGLLIVVILCVKGYQGLMEVGVYTGYQPTQPIKFDHSLHAGENEIACVYCHHSAPESQHAGIPSANICMNCHEGISQGRSEEGTAEIQKIYDAVGWSPDEMAYTGETQPIKWVKVHNLPDLAYFNHSQHVTVAGLACEECHGPVSEEYTVAKQHSELTMGWCINCHNETAVNMEGGYYDEIHARLVSDGKDALKEYLEDGVITAKELGGWECAKCHY